MYLLVFAWRSLILLAVCLDSELLFHSNVMALPTAVYIVSPTVHLHFSTVTVHLTTVCHYFTAVHLYSIVVHMYFSSLSFKLPLWSSPVSLGFRQ